MDPYQAKKRRTEVESHPADPEQAAVLIEMIRQARKPVVIAGSGAWYAGAEAALIAFIEKTGLPVFTAGLGQGTVRIPIPCALNLRWPFDPGPVFLHL